MATTFILKRKNYALPAIAAIGSKIAGSGAMKTAGTAVGGAMTIQDVKSTVEDREDKQEFDYTKNPNQNQPQQSNFSAGQAIKEVATGVGKGIFNYAKKNKKSLGGLAAFGGSLAAGSYGMNRIQRQRAEIDAGEREANGMSTGGKLVAGATALGTGAYLANKAGKSHDKTAADLSKKAAQEGRLANELSSKGQNKAADLAKGRATTATENLNKMNRKRLGGLVSNRSFKMGRNALIGGGLVAGAGLLANSMLKDKRNSEIDQKEYSWAAVGRVIKSKLGHTSGGTAKTWDLIKQNATQGKEGWNRIGQAAGTAIKAGSKQAAKTVSNFLTVGKGGASQLTKDVTNSLKNQGEYGKKAADFINKHKTAAGVVGAATVGTAGFQLANAAGEKPVQLAAKLDKKTDQFVKNQQQGMGG